MTTQNKLALQEIVLQHTAENLTMQRAGAALGLGLMPSDYVRHFPQNNTNINIQPAPAVPAAAQQPATPPATQTPDPTPPPVTKPTTPVDPPVAAKPTSTTVSPVTKDPLAGLDDSSTTSGTYLKAALFALLPMTGLLGYLAHSYFNPPTTAAQPPAVATPAEAAAKVHIFYGDQEILPDKPATATLPVTK